MKENKKEGGESPLSYRLKLKINSRNMREKSLLFRNAVMWRSCETNKQNRKWHALSYERRLRWWWWWYWWCCWLDVDLSLFWRSTPGVFVGCELLKQTCFTQKPICIRSYTAVVFQNYISTKCDDAIEICILILV